MSTSYLAANRIDRTAVQPKVSHGKRVEMRVRGGSLDSEYPLDVASTGPPAKIYLCRVTPALCAATFPNRDPTEDAAFVEGLRSAIGANPPAADVSLDLAGGGAGYGFDGILGSQDALILLSGSRIVPEGPGNEDHTYHRSRTVAVAQIGPSVFTVFQSVFPAIAPAPAAGVADLHSIMRGFDFGDTARTLNGVLLHCVQLPADCGARLRKSHLTGGHMAPALLPLGTRLFSMGRQMNAALTQTFQRLLGENRAGNAMAWVNDMTRVASRMFTSLLHALDNGNPGNLDFARWTNAGHRKPFGDYLRDSKAALDAMIAAAGKNLLDTRPVRVYLGLLIASFFGHHNQAIPPPLMPYVLEAMVPVVSPVAHQHGSWCSESVDMTPVDGGVVSVTGVRPTVPLSGRVVGGIVRTYEARFYPPASRLQRINGCRLISNEEPVYNVMGDNGPVKTGHNLRINLLDLLSTPGGHYDSIFKQAWVKEILRMRRAPYNMVNGNVVFDATPVNAIWQNGATNEENLANQRATAAYHAELIRLAVFPNQAAINAAIAGGLDARVQAWVGAGAGRVAPVAPAMARTFPAEWDNEPYYAVVMRLHDMVLQCTRMAGVVDTERPNSLDLGDYNMILCGQTNVYMPATPDRSLVTTAALRFRNPITAQEFKARHEWYESYIALRSSGSGARMPDLDPLHDILPILDLATPDKITQANSTAPMQAFLTCSSYHPAVANVQVNANLEANFRDMCAQVTHTHINSSPPIPNRVPFQLIERTDDFYLASYRVYLSAGLL